MMMVMVIMMAMGMVMVMAATSMSMETSPWPVVAAACWRSSSPSARIEEMAVLHSTTPLQVQARV